MADELKPVYLLMGTDRPKVDRALGRLRARFAADGIEVLDAQEASGADAVAACNALGLFAAGRLVIVSGAERWKAGDTEVVKAYLENPAPATVLALVAETLKRGAPLAKVCAARGDVLVFDVSRSELPNWAGKQFARLGVQADSAACRALAAIVGDDPRALEIEVEKLAAWSGGEPIGVREVESIAVPHGEPPAFELVDAWGRRDAAGVLRACELEFERSGDPTSRVISRLVFRLAQHVDRVLTAQGLGEAGIRPRDALKQLSVRHPFAAEKAYAHAENFSREELEDAVVRLAALDLALKGGSRLPAELELARALAEVTKARKPVPASG
jgi:DNA polymerase III delta subunit